MQLAPELARNPPCNRRNLSPNLPQTSFRLKTPQLSPLGKQLHESRKALLDTGRGTSHKCCRPKPWTGDTLWVLVSFPRSFFHEKEEKTSSSGPLAAEALQRGRRVPAAARVGTRNHEPGS